tara:strand:+ start:1135 stop:1698 length:564 start_codon:yes stop_codon:yes gene_type:complete
MDKKLEKLTRELILEIGEDPNREGLTKTPLRVAKAWEFFSKGYRQNIDEIINDAIFEEDSKDLVIIRDIEFFSLCEHHLLPFFGRAHVGYMPNGKVLGLSKIPRLVDMFSRRLQVQERLTNQIANSIQSVLNPKGVAVLMEGRHMCMQMRGVEKQNSLASTSCMIGKLRESNATRSEFLSIINRDKV